MVQSLVATTMQYFTTQLRDQQDRNRPLRAAQYSKARSNTDTTGQNEPPTQLDEEEEEEDDEQTHQSATVPSSAASSAPQLVQLRVAGLLPGQENDVPPAPFPHAPATASTQQYGPAKIQEEMATTPVRLYAVNSASKTGLDHGGQREAHKRAHLHHLSTLMHCCLLKGDYERAGRAWGMILRTQVAGGRPVDARNHGRWGVGAEIALRRKPASPDQIARFSDEGFELAREYYHRLIIQHPNRKLQPHAVDDRIFYPPMFSLWIYEVCEKSRRARLRLQDEVANRSRSSRSMSIASSAEERPDDSCAKEDAIQSEELTRAMEIAERLDQVIASPPFDRQASLLQLRGNVSLWISDLTMGKTGTNEDWSPETFTPTEPGSTDSVANRLQRLTNSQRELKGAQAFFDRAAVNGAQGQAATLSNITLKLREVAKYMEQLRPSRRED